MKPVIVRALLGAAAIAALGAAAAPASAQLQDDTIRFATRSISPGFGRPEFGAASPGVYTLYPMYDSLTQASPTGDISGSLAESWKNVDALTWHFTLKRGVKFHNGEELTSDAVVEQFKWLLNPASAGLVASQANRNQVKVAAATAIDDYTVELKTAVPNPEMPRMLAAIWMPEPKAWRDRGTEGFAREPVGTGPYMNPVFTGGIDGSVDLVAFEDAMRKPKVKNLRIMALPEAASRVSAILSNEIDISQGVPFDAMGEIEGAGHKVDVASRPSAMGWRFMSVRTKSPFHDKRVRQAANYAVDRFAMAEDLLGGITVPASQCATRATFGYNPDIEPYPYDPEKAKQLLAEAGYPNGFDTEAQVIVGSFPADNEIVQLAAQQLTAVGIRTKLTLITFPEWLDKWLGNTRGPENTMGFSDIFKNSCHNNSAIPFDAYPNLSCRKEFPSHCDEEEYALLQKAEQEFDVETRRKLIQELMVLNHENAPNLFFVEIVDLTGLHKRVQGFNNLIQRFSFHDVTLTN